MSNITSWINERLYGELYTHIDRAFPELDFKYIGGNWMSSKKMDCSSPRDARRDKTKISKNIPGRIFEQGGGSKSLVDYVIERDSIDFIQAVKYLAEIAGLDMPKGDFNQESYQRQKEKENILEDCNSYFTYSL